MEDETRKKWHLEKTISIGHILTTLVVAASAMSWIAHVDNRLAVLETLVEYHAKTDIKTEQMGRESLEHIDAALIRIEQKLDNKQDKRR